MHDNKSRLPAVTVWCSLLSSSKHAADTPIYRARTHCFYRSASSPNGWKVIERFRDFIEKREWKLVRDVVKYARPAERLRGCQYVLE